LPRTGISGVLIACALMFGAAEIRAQVFSADAVKAAFLYRFASYVEWPPEASPDQLVIGIAGGEGVAQQLELLLPRMSAHGRAARIQRVTRASELDGVHILYVGRDLLARTRAMRAAAAQRPILVVTDDEGGLEAGSVINFLDADRNVRFEISQSASDRARLKIDSALLSVAARVERR